MTSLVIFPSFVLVRDGAMLTGHTSSCVFFFPAMFHLMSSASFGVFASCRRSSSPHGAPFLPHSSESDYPIVHDPCVDACTLMPSPTNNLLSFCPFPMAIHILTSSILVIDSIIFSAHPFTIGKILPFSAYFSYFFPFHRNFLSCLELSRVSLSLHSLHR
ncbi:hypothetical protein BS17DRAFT_85343 [Gyrodon lividus]|nr:hypothetical protein BS17DRAFT_85343 [Gyrodon lividus]